MQTISGPQSWGQVRRSDSNGLSYSELKLVSVCKIVHVDGHPKMRLFYYAEVKERQRGRSRFVPLTGGDGNYFAVTVENAALLRANTTRMNPVAGTAGSSQQIEAYVVTVDQPAQRDLPRVNAAATVRRAPLRGLFSNVTPPASPRRGGRVHGIQRVSEGLHPHVQHVNLSYRAEDSSMTSRRRIGRPIFPSQRTISVHFGTREEVGLTE